MQPRYTSTGMYDGSSRDAIAAFAAELHRARVPATVRPGAGTSPRRAASWPPPRAPALALDGSQPGSSLARRNVVMLDARMDDDGLGWRFWGGFLGAVVAIGFGLLLFFVLLSGAFYRWGALGALVGFGAVLLLFGWIYDRRHARDYE